MGGWDGLAIMIAVGVGFGAVSILLGRLLGPRHPTPEKMAPYECGMPPVGDARDRHPVKFYLVAISFLLFDVEVAFTYPWAMALRDIGWYGFTLMAVFFVPLIVGFVYEWKKGVLDWGQERV